MNSNPAASFIHYLEQLSRILAKVEAFAAGDPVILDARLAPDMFPFAQQIRITANFALRGCCPLAGLDVVTFDTNEDSFASLHRQISDTRDFLQAMSVDDFKHRQDTHIQDRAGFSDLSLPAPEFLLQYAFGNFLFHLSMTYAIARQRGVPISKGDFDGYHQYPPGFAFEHP